MHLTQLIWLLFCRFARLCLICGVFTGSLWAAQVNDAHFSADGKSLHIERRHWDWPEFSFITPLALTFLADFFLWIWPTGGRSVVMGNVVQRGGTIDASIGKTTVYV